METMNIYAKKGDKVCVTEWSAENGRDDDVEKSKNMIGSTYTVERTIVSGFNTRVHLQGIEGSFNSVNFVDESNKDKSPEEMNIAMVKDFAPPVSGFESTGDNCFFDNIACCFCINQESSDCPVKSANNWSRHKNFCNEFENSEGERLSIIKVDK